jgi:uncharacterized protein (TIGR04255 family)
MGQRLGSSTAFYTTTWLGGREQEAMAKTPKYKNPPLVEVITDFFFQPPDGKEWDSFALPGFYKKIAKGYPIRQNLTTVGIEMRLTGGGASPEFQQYGPPTPRHRFLSDDQKTLVQIGDNLLAVNQLPPYYGWERYEPKVAECFELYSRTWKPTRVARAAVHYIDKVDLPEAEAGLEKYFNLVPVLPEFPGVGATNVWLGYEISGATPGDLLKVTMKQHPSANPEGMTFLFQWDYIATNGLSVDLATVRDWLSEAHMYLHNTFESTFTDQCRKLFD